MAPRRQRLSQRRKAVGLAQGPLAGGRGGERSIAARWEVGDTQPLPSVRPDVAVSSSSRVPPVAQPVSAEFGRSVVVDVGPDAAIRLPAARLEGLADIDHPADINIASAGIGPNKPGPRTVEVGGFARSCLPAPTQADVQDLSFVTTIPLNIPLANVQRRPDSSRRFKRFKRFTAAGVLALVGGTASVSFLTSHNGPIPPATVGNPAPITAVPAPNSNEFTGAPAAAPNQPADAPAAVSTPTQTSQSKSPAAKIPPPRPRTPAIPAEAYTWSRMAELSGSDQSRARLRSEFPSQP